MTSLNLLSISERICLDRPISKEVIIEAFNGLSLGKLPGTDSLGADSLKLFLHPLSTEVF